MSSLFTEIECEVCFGKLGADSHISKVNLFEKEQVQLNGEWSAESVVNYCKQHALKKGYAGKTLEITIYDDQYNEQFLKVEI